MLSETGARQAHALGTYWANHDQRIDALYAGPRRRHRDTAHHLRTGASARGVDYPEAQEVAGLDEYPAFALLRHWQPILAAEDADFQALLQGPDRAGKQRVEQAFQYIVDKWARGQLDTGELETFAHFQARVRAAISGIAEREGRGRTIAVVTSGGPICMAVQWALSLADGVAIRQSWVIGNGSVSEFRYRDPHAIALIGFNAMGYLRAPDLITYR